MDGAVDEDPAGELCVFDEEAGRIEFVAGLRAEDTGDAYGTSGDFVGGVTVRGVEAAGEGAHDFLVGIGEEGLLVGGDDGLGEVDACAQGFLAEYVEAALDGFDGLFGVHGGGGGDDHGFEVIFGVEHLVEGEVGADTGEFALSPLEFGGFDGSCCDEVGSRGHGVEMEGVSFAHAAEADDGGLELLRRHWDGGLISVKVFWVFSSK